jgi:hypothetical protein
MDATVNPLLREAGSSFLLRSAPAQPPEWAEEVTLAHLLDHTGLGMHYVNGVPLSEPMPPVEALISGSKSSPAPYRLLPVADPAKTISVHWAISATSDCRPQPHFQCDCCENDRWIPGATDMSMQCARACGGWGGCWLGDAGTATPALS